MMQSTLSICENLKAYVVRQARKSRSLSTHVMIEVTEMASQIIPATETDTPKSIVPTASLHLLRYR